MRFNYLRIFIEDLESVGIFSGTILLIVFNLPLLIVEENFRWNGIILSNFVVLKVIE
jgi:hypothetical protein